MHSNGKEFSLQCPTEWEMLYISPGTSVLFAALANEHTRQTALRGDQSVRAKWIFHNFIDKVKWIKSFIILFEHNGNNTHSWFFITLHLTSTQLEVCRSYSSYDEWVGGKSQLCPFYLKNNCFYLFVFFKGALIAHVKGNNGSNHSQMKVEMRPKAQKLEHNCCRILNTTSNHLQFHWGHSKMRNLYHTIITFIAILLIFLWYSNIIDNITVNKFRNASFHHSCPINTI